MSPSALSALAAIVSGTLALAGCASAPPMGGDGPQQAGPPPGLFVSPFGELFAAEPGAPWPVADWFAGADADADGRLTASEYTADGARWFRSLDRSGDGRLNPQEVALYEQVLVEARARMPGFGGPGQRGPGRRLQGFGGGMALGETGTEPQQGPPQGVPRGESGGPAGRRRAPSGALAYGPIAAAGFFNYPQPVKAADLDTNQTITAEEWAMAGDRWFVALDTDRDGVLTLATLPQTPLQQLMARRR